MTTRTAPTAGRARVPCNPLGRWIGLRARDCSSSSSSCLAKVEGDPGHQNKQCIGRGTWRPGCRTSGSGVESVESHLSRLALGTSHIRLSRFSLAIVSRSRAVDVRRRLQRDLLLWSKQPHTDSIPLLIPFAPGQPWPLKGLLLSL